MAKCKNTVFGAEVLFAYGCDSDRLSQATKSLLRDLDKQIQS